MKKLNFYFLSIFPDLFEVFMNHSIVKRAIKNDYISVNLINLRDFTFDKHKTVDDFQFGGGNGMVLMVEPIYKVIQKLKTDKNGNLITILLTPQGNIWNQNQAKKILENKNNNILLISGNYEGFDERIRDFVDFEISIGDYILTGGELSSLVVFNTLIRLVPKVIKNLSKENESFTIDGRLDFPVYTKPRNFLGKKVPEVLLSGHHKNIEKWRKIQSIKKTIKRRPDLIKKFPLLKEEKDLIDK